jgi:hypothetical protein
MSTSLLHEPIRRLLHTHGEDVLHALTLQEQRALNLMILAIELYAEAKGDPIWRGVALISMRATVKAMGADARAVAEKNIPLVLEGRREPDLWDVISGGRVGRGGG